MHGAGPDPIPDTMDSYYINYLVRPGKVVLTDDGRRARIQRCVARGPSWMLFEVILEGQDTSVSQISSLVLT